MSLKVVSLITSIDGFRIGPMSFDVEAGEVLSILGPSGSGKTILLKTIAGLHRIEEGEIWLDGMNITDLPPHKRKIAFVFQDDALFPHLRTFENLGFPLRIMRKPRKVVDLMVKEKAEELDGLPGYLSRMPSELPKGMKKLTAIGRETIKDFKLILMDEPLEHLDKRVREEMRVFLKRIIRGINVTTLIVLNDPLDAMVLADEIILMRNGRMISHGKPMDLFENPKDVFTLRYFSPHGLNEVMTYVKDGIESLFDLRVNLRDGIYTLMIRPEDFEHADHGKDARILNESFVDSRKRIVEFELEKIEMRAILREKLADTLKVKPRRAFFVKDEEVVLRYEGENG